MTITAYSVLTPFIIPDSISHIKRVNIGDGFVLSNTIRLLEPFIPKYIFSTRSPLSSKDIEKINQTKALIIAGTNQLSDDFEVAHAFTSLDIEKINVPIIPFGIGVTGVTSQNQSMSEESKKILRKIHEKINFSSWRCPLTVEYLKENLHDLSKKFVLTGCPVIFDNPLLNKQEFGNETKKIIVTFTDRGRFLDREKATISFVARKYPLSEKILSLHQFYSGNLLKSSGDIISIKSLFRTKKLSREYIKSLVALFRLIEFSEKLGFTIFCSDSVLDYYQLYQSSDLHFGSRLHAHLYFLSQNKKSYLAYVDERCTGFSQMLRFPIIHDPSQFQYQSDFNFESYRNQAKLVYSDMINFVNYLKEDILSK
jgi:hypothetical protein